MTYPGQRARPRAALAALSAALIVAIGVAIWGWLDRPRTGSSTTPSTTAAVSAANRVAVDLTTFDYRSLDAAFARIKADGTTAFGSSFEATSADTRAFDERAKVISTGTVIASAAQPVAADGTVTVLLFVDQRLRSVGSSVGQLEHARIEMVMKQVGGVWLADKVTVSGTS